MCGSYGTISAFTGVYKCAYLRCMCACWCLSRLKAYLVFCQKHMIGVDASVIWTPVGRSLSFSQRVIFLRSVFLSETDLFQKQVRIVIKYYKTCSGWVVNFTSFVFCLDLEIDTWWGTFCWQSFFFLNQAC